MGGNLAGNGYTEPLQPLCRFPEQVGAHPVWLGGGSRVAADSAGMFFASVARDARVAKGAVVGYTIDYLGRRTGDVRAPIAGVVTFIRGVPSVWPRGGHAPCW